MKRLKSNFINMVLVLSGISIFAAFALSSVYSLTKDSINQEKNTKQQEAIRAVLPPYDHFDSKPIEMNDGVEIMKVHKAYNKKNEVVGAAVESSSNNGYKGQINIIVGFNKKGVIIDYIVLEHNETPGLGAKMVNWFKTDNANQNIRGKNAATANLNLSKEGGEIDAITGATISSRAFLFAVRNAYYAFTSNNIAPKIVTKSIVDTLHQANDSASNAHKNDLKGNIK